MSTSYGGSSSSRPSGPDRIRLRRTGLGPDWADRRGFNRPAIPPRGPRMEQVRCNLSSRIPTGAVVFDCLPTSIGTVIQRCGVVLNWNTEYLVMRDWNRRPLPYEGTFDTEYQVYFDSTWSYQVPFTSWCPRDTDHDWVRDRSEMFLVPVRTVEGNYFFLRDWREGRRFPIPDGLILDPGLHMEQEIIEVHHRFAAFEAQCDEWLRPIRSDSTDSE